MTCIVTKKGPGATLFERQSEFGSTCDLRLRGLGHMAKIPIYGNRHFPRESSSRIAIAIDPLVISYKLPSGFHYSRIDPLARSQRHVLCQVSSESAHADTVPKLKGVTTDSVLERPCHLGSPGDIEMGISRDSNGTLIFVGSRLFI